MSPVDASGMSMAGPRKAPHEWAIKAFAQQCRLLPKMLELPMAQQWYLVAAIDVAIDRVSAKYIDLRAAEELSIENERLRDELSRIGEELADMEKMLASIEEKL